MQRKIFTHFIYFLFSFLLVFAFTLRAQSTARIKGKIIDASTGEALPGANIILRGTNFGAASDRYGNYQIMEIPLGKYILAVSYIGYNSDTIEVNLTKSNTYNINAKLKISAVQMKDVVIAGLLQGQVKAINQQKNSQVIENVISRQEMEKFPDMNTADVLQRIPGVYIERSLGEGQYVYIRGTTPDLTSITVDGQQLATTNDEERITDLGIINSTQLASIEVKKTLTPDMDASGIGGQVNLVTRMPFDYDRSTLKLDIGGGYAVQGKKNLYRASGSYVGFFGSHNKFGYTVAASYYKNQIEGQEESFGWSDQTTIYRKDIPFALHSFNLYNNVAIRNHYGVSADLQYKLDDNNTFHVSAMYNLKDDQSTEYDHYYRLGDGLYIDSADIRSSRMDYSMINEPTQSQLIAWSAGGKSNLSGLDLDYNFSYSTGSENRSNPPRVRSEWAILQRPNFHIDFSNPDYPKFEVTSTNMSPDYIYDPSSYHTDTQELKWISNRDVQTGGIVNAKLPYDLFGIPALLKAGIKYSIDKKSRVGTTQRMKWQGPGQPTMDQVSNFESIQDFLNGNYIFAPIVDPQKGRDLILNDQLKTPGMALDMGGSGVVIDGDGVGGRYDNFEGVYAIYAMTNFNWGNLNVMVGVRDELTKTDYEGYNILFDIQGNAASFNTKGTKTNYNNIFPNVQLKYSFGSETNLRLAYTESIARPNYYDLAPYNFMDPQEKDIEAGNPNLRPTFSRNYDLMFAHYFQGIGEASVGLFYKDLTDLIYGHSWTQIGGQFDGFDMSMPVNAGKAKLYGVELNWMQQFTFLPGIFGGFGIYANYTYTKSEANLTYRSWTVMPGQAGNVGNLGLSYERYGITARLSANYRSKLLQSIGDTPIYDKYTDNNIRLDFTGIYKLFENLSIYVDVLNITNERDKSYEGIVSRPTSIQFYGISGDAGVKFSL